MQSSICNITNLTPHTLVTCGVARYQPSGIHVTNLSNVLFFSEKNKVFKKKNKMFSLEEQELLKIWPVVFFITVSTCRNAFFFLQIFQPLRKHPTRGHSGWRIGLRNPSDGGWNVSAELIFLRFLGNRFSWRIFSGWNISQYISFSRNADRQGVCGVAERSEGKKRRFGM